MKKVKKKSFVLFFWFYFDRDFWVSNGLQIVCNAMVFWDDGPKRFYSLHETQVWSGRWPLLWSQTVEPPEN